MKNYFTENGINRVYIASPLRGTKQEIKRNMEACKDYMETVQREFGIKTMALHHLLPLVLDDDDQTDRTLALKWGKEALLTCDALFVCGDHVSEGMAGEIRTAIIHEIPVFVFNVDLAENLRYDCIYYPTTLDLGEGMKKCA